MYNIYISYIFMINDIPFMGVSIPMRQNWEYHPIQPLAPTHGGSPDPPRDIDMLRVTRLGSLDFSGRLGLSRFNWARSRNWQLDSLSVISVLWKFWNVGNSIEHIQFHPALLQKTKCIYLGEVFFVGLTTSQDFTMENMAPPPPKKMLRPRTALMLLLPEIS